MNPDVTTTPATEDSLAEARVALKRARVIRSAVLLVAAMLLFFGVILTTRDGRHKNDAIQDAEAHALTLRERTEPLGVLPLNLDPKPPTVDTAGGPVKILGRKELIEMKRASGRVQDLEDVKALEKLS